MVLLIGKPYWNVPPSDWYAIAKSITNQVRTQPCAGVVIITSSWAQNLRRQLLFLLRRHIYYSQKWIDMLILMWCGQDINGAMTMTEDRQMENIRG